MLAFPIYYAEEFLHIIRNILVFVVDDTELSLELKILNAQNVNIPVT